MTPIPTWVSRYIILAVAVFSAACDGGSGPDPASLRFGQVGEIRVTLAVPLAVDRGELQQTLIWGGANLQTVDDQKQHPFARRNN